MQQARAKVFLGVRYGDMPWPVGVDVNMMRTFDASQYPARFKHILD